MLFSLPLGHLAAASKAGEKSQDKSERENEREWVCQPLPMRVCGVGEVCVPPPLFHTRLLLSSPHGGAWGEAVLVLPSVCVCLVRTGHPRPCKERVRTASKNGQVQLS
jgi:hypothetical protein